jgi:hypothetical protein
MGRSGSRNQAAPLFCAYQGKFLKPEPINPFPLVAADNKLFSLNCGGSKPLPIHLKSQSGMETRRCKWLLSASELC